MSAQPQGATKSNGPAKAFPAGVSLLSKRLGLDNYETRRFMERLGRLVAVRVLVKRERVYWPGLGTFFARNLASTTSQLHGKRYTTPARTAVGFRPVKSVKRASP